MKFYIFSRPDAKHSPEGMNSLARALEHYGVDFHVNRGFASELREKAALHIPQDKVYENLQGENIGPDDILLCYGGDGTILEGVRRLAGKAVPLLGINAGRLGFLANIPPQQTDAAIGEILAGRYEVEKRSMLAAEGDFAPVPDFPYAFNEFAVQRHSAAMINVQVYADDDMVASCHGDGVIVSTPSGSTAYSLSVGGPIVSPQCRCMVISPIAPHNLSMRPVVIPDSAHLTLHVCTRGEKAQVSLDNMTFEAPTGARFRLRKAEISVFLIRLQNISFYDTLRNKMMWGLDQRDLHK